MKSVLRKENLDDNAKIVPIILNLRNFNEINKLIFESWSNFTAEFVICSKETESLGIKSIKKKLYCSRKRLLSRQILRIAGKVNLIYFHTAPLLPSVFSRSDLKLFYYSFHTLTNKRHLLSTRCK